MARQIIQPQTPQDFEHYYDLRWKILRQPWSQPKGSEKDDLEEKSFHLMALDGETVVGVGRVHFNSPEEAQVRYMAIAEGYQRKGVGSAILKGLEQKALDKGAKWVVLNSREAVIPFYQKQGYVVTEDAPTLFSEIKHKKMQKKL